MSDKDYLLEMLTTEKNISVNLVYALNEASNKNIYDLYFKMFKSINKITKDIYEENRRLLKKLEEAEKEVRFLKKQPHSSQRKSIRAIPIY